MTSMRGNHLELTLLQQWQWGDEAGVGELFELGHIR